jgi:hypothetical protein
VLAAGKQDVGIDESMEEEIANRVAAIVSVSQVNLDLSQLF